MTTHENLVAALGGFTDRYIACNTTVGLDNEHGYYLKLYDTYLLTSIRGIVTVNTDGFRTATTKRRLNAFLGSDWRLIQRSGCWFWSRRERGVKFSDGDTLDLRDELTAQASVTGERELLTA